MITIFADTARKNVESSGTYNDHVKEDVCSRDVLGQKKNVHNAEPDDRKRNEMDASQMSNSGDDSNSEGTSAVLTKLLPGKVFDLASKHVIQK